MVWHSWAWAAAGRLSSIIRLAAATMWRMPFNTFRAEILRREKMRGAHRQSSLASTLDRRRDLSELRFSGKLILQLLMNRPPRAPFASVLTLLNYFLQDVLKNFQVMKLQVIINWQILPRPN